MAASRSAATMKKRTWGTHANLWWIDAGYACGGVLELEGKVLDAAPIFRKWIGRKVSSLPVRKRVRCKT